MGKRNILGSLFIAYKLLIKLYLNKRYIFYVVIVKYLHEVLLLCSLNLHSWAIVGLIIRFVD